MPFESNDVSAAIFEIRDLMRLIAQPAVAERDQKRRSEILRIVGASPLKARSVLLMDGTRNQVTIHKETGFSKGHLSTLVKQLSDAGVLIGDVKQPNLAIRLPEDFFEGIA